MHTRRCRAGVRWKALAATALFMASSACDPNEIGRVTAALELNERLDFGPVSLARSRSMPLVITNNGRGSVTLGKPYFDEPVPKDFAFAARENTRIPPGDKTEISVSFTPAVIGGRAARLFIPTDSEKFPLLTIDLVGEGVLGRAELGVRRIDFGRVGLQATATQPLPLRNETPTPADVELYAPTGDDAHAFAAEPSGNVRVDPSAERLAEVRFAPRRIGFHEARILVRPCPSCDMEEVELVGEGIAAALVVDPPEIDFDYVDPNTTARRTVSVTNRGTQPVTLRTAGLGSSSSPAFGVPPLPAGGVVLGQDERTEVEVTFTPPSLDPQHGSLRITTSDPFSPALVVPLRGFGGGPKISVAPSPLSFPRTGVGMTIEKNLSLRNVGHDPGGNRPLIVSDVYVSSGAEFRIRDSRGEPPPYELGVGEARTFHVSYQPMSAGTATGEVTFESNDAQFPQLRVPLHATGIELGPCTYSVVPHQLDFGAVSAGGRARLAFSIRNQGENPCAVANPRLTRSSSTALTVDRFNSVIVEPGEMLLVYVNFAPTSGDRHTGMVQVDISSPTDPLIEVPVVAHAVNACLQIEPERLDFGTVGLACRAPTLPVMVRNGCGTSVDIHDTWIGSGATESFDFSGGGARSLPPGAEVRLDVTYTPDAEQSDSAPLYVDTSLGGPPRLVSLEGRGVLRPTNTDTFDVPLEQMVDVLVVMDNSGSMTDLQDYIGTNFDRFMASAIARGIDFHVAVTTTGLWGYQGGWSQCPGGVDGGEAGRFYPVTGVSPRILTPQTPNVRAAFNHNVHVGICHWWEEGLEAARLALSPPLIDNADAPNHPERNDGNAGFMREDAKLYVVYISDEEDHGTQPTQVYVDHLRSLKPGRPDLVSASAIVGFPSCSLSPSAGFRYMEVVNAMGGLVEDVCNPDWGGVLQRIGDDAFTPVYTYPLSQRPDGRDITVSVGGGVVESRSSDGTRRWRYDPLHGDHGAVIFEDGFAPGPGQTVEISYAIPCP